VIDRFTAGATSLVVITGVLATRWAVSPTPARGRHRAERVRAVLDDSSLDELLGPWPQPAYGAAVSQQWAYCQPCGKDTAGVVHKDGWTCGECFWVLTGGAQ
jgi:ribosomal protein S27AE